MESQICDYCTEDPAAFHCEECNMHTCKICDPVLHANPKKRGHVRTAISAGGSDEKKGSDDEKETDEEKVFAERLARYKKRERSKQCRIMVIGLSQHGKSTTLNTIFGEEVFPSGKSGTSCTVSVKERAHPKDPKLVFIDTPGLSDTTRNDKEIFKGIMKYAKGKPLDCILICRRFTHPNTKDYMILKQLTQTVSKEWKKTPIVIVYTRSHDKPDANIANGLTEDLEKYSKEPYNYSRKQQKFAAFRNLRIIQAKRDGFHACFFFENQGADEDWKLLDGSSCLDPLVNFLAQLSPDVVPDMLSKGVKSAFSQKDGIFGHIMLMVENLVETFKPRIFKKDKSNKNNLPRAMSGMCHGCTYINEKDAVDCSLCQAPLELTYCIKDDEDE